MKQLRLLNLFAVALAGVAIHASSALAVDPNPLENAYWRFEEGTPGSPVPIADNAVPDSANANHLRAFNADTAPQYVDTVAPWPLYSGLSNTAALQFTPHPGGGDDLYAVEKNINNGMIGPPVAPGVSGFTLEAAFRPDVVNAFQGIVAREGQPGGPLPTLALKTLDNGNLIIELFDNAGNLVNVQSSSPLVAGNWYAAAAVNDGSNLELYLHDGAGYVLQGSTPVSGALYQGANNNWEHNWVVGRAYYDGDSNPSTNNSADWFHGIIDEVRLTNSALSPSQFLFAPIPEPGTIALALLAVLGVGPLRIGRNRRRK